MNRHGLRDRVHHMLATPAVSEKGMQKLASRSYFSPPPPSYLVDAGPHVLGDPHQNVLLSPLDIDLEQGNPASEPQRMEGSSEQGGGEEGLVDLRQWHSAALNREGGDNNGKLRGQEHKEMKASVPCSHPTLWRSISSPTVVVLHSSCASVQHIHYGQGIRRCGTYHSLPAAPQQATPLHATNLHAAPLHAAKFHAAPAWLPSGALP